MPLMTKRHKALAAITVCVLFWGFSFVSIKIAVEVFPPMTLGAIRFIIAVIFLFFIKRKMAPGEKIHRKDILFLAGAGLMGVTLYFFFENNGVALVPASEASIIVAVIPVITMIAEELGDRISLYRKKRAGMDVTNLGRSPARVFFSVAGTIISLGGVGLVAGVSLSLSGTARGYFFMAGACICWVCYCFLTRPLFVNHSRIFIVFWQSVVGLFGFLPFAFMDASWHIPAPHVMGHVVFLGICCSAMGYWLYALALETLGVGTTSIFLNFIPVVTALAGFFVLGEKLLALQWLGAALVFAGVYLAMIASRASKTSKK